MSLGDVMCKYKHIGTDFRIRPYVFGISIKANSCG